MSKVVVKFFKGHGPYVKGDIAGFEPEKARQLRSVAALYDADAEAKFEQADPRGAAAAAADLEQRTKDLEAREAELAKREAALKDAAPAPAPAAAADPAPKAQGGKGEPPAQGGTDTAAKK